MSEDISQARGLKAGSSEGNNPSEAKCLKGIITLEFGGPKDDPAFEAHLDDEYSKEV